MQCEPYKCYTPAAILIHVQIQHKKRHLHTVLHKGILTCHPYIYGIYYCPFYQKCTLFHVFTSKQQNTQTHANTHTFAKTPQAHIMGHAALLLSQTKKNKNTQKREGEINQQITKKKNINWKHNINIKKKGDKTLPLHKFTKGP